MRLSLPWSGGLVAGLLSSACLEVNGRRSEMDWDPSPYQAEVEEGPGASLAIVLDTSGSMRDPAPGDTRPKHEVAVTAVREMLDATDAFLAKRPDFPVKVAIYHFSSAAWRLMSIAPYDRAKIQYALSSLPAPGGGTAIGEGMLSARPELYRGGTFRKYLLVITDGENTSGVDPARVARHIHRKSEGAVSIYFVAFDTSPEKFAFLKEVGGEVIAAGNGAELRAALEQIYQGKILAEEEVAGEPH